MTLYLQEISQTVPPSRYAVLILGQAGWHTRPKLPQFTNLTLLPLPAGSPELNAAKLIWQQLRDRSLAGRWYNSYDQIVEACCEAWNKFTQIPALFDHCAPVADLPEA